MGASAPSLCWHCLCQAPLMKAVDIRTQIAKTGNTMGLFPLSSPSPWDLCTVCHSPAWTALKHRDTAPKPSVSGATAKLHKEKWLCPLQAWNLFTLNLCRAWLAGVKSSEIKSIHYSVLLYAGTELRHSVLLKADNKQIWNTFEMLTYPKKPISSTLLRSIKLHPRQSAPFSLF